MDGNEKLETMLEDIIGNADKQKTLSSELGIDSTKED
jgi:predicted component of type VI protein secretion system